ncbi:hypothetical protein BSR55_13810 [Acinetobacter bereziniae]|nr:hypothetical protein BSR55_13810 [Acinetobacter bereziniae]
MIIEDEHNSSVSAMIFYGIFIKNAASLKLEHNINLTVYPASIWAVKNFFGGSSSINLHSIKTMLSD